MTTRIVETFTESFTTDTEMTDDETLISSYNGLSEEGKAAVNDFLISLCGWSFESLREQAGYNSDIDRR